MKHPPHIRTKNESFACNAGSVMVLVAVSMMAIVGGVGVALDVSRSQMV